MFLFLYFTNASAGRHSAHFFAHSKSTTNKAFRDSIVADVDDDDDDEEEDGKNSAFG